MDYKILQDVNKHERLQYLKDSAEKAEDYNYPRPLDENELLALKDQYTTESITLTKLEEKKKDFMYAYKFEVKPIQIQQSELITKIRNKVEEVNEEVYLIADQDEGAMGYYNSEGVLVNSRPLYQEERQFRIIDKPFKKVI